MPLPVTDDGAIFGFQNWALRLGVLGCMGGLHPAARLHHMERIGRTAAHLRPSAPTSVVLTTSLDAAATAAAGGAGHGSLSPATHDDELGLDLELLYSCCEELVARGATPGVCVAVARHGKLLPPRAFGFAGPDAGADVNQGLEAGAELQPSSIFLVASVTKPVVATAVVQLVEQGRLDLDAPVSSLIPAFATSSAGASDPFRGDARAAVTVRHLLTHTSGLPDAVSEEPRFSSYAPLIGRRAAVCTRTRMLACGPAADSNLLAFRSLRTTNCEHVRPRSLTSARS
jgi:CubicO group peptidase (beta-lactamase class C family)